MAHKELYSSGIHERLGKRFWALTRTYAMPNAQARGFEDAMWNARAAGYPEPYAPRCRRIRRRTNWTPGITKVTLYFRTVRVPGKAKLFIRLGSNPEKAQFDQSDPPLQLEGPIHTGTATDGLNYARTISGSNIIHRPSVRIVLKTAYERSSFSARQIKETAQLVGRINKYRLPNFGDFLPGTLLLLGAPSSQVWDEDDLWLADYVFAYEPNGWNHPTQRQVFTKLPRKMPILTAAGVVATGTREIMVEVAKKITAIDADGNITLAETTPDDTVKYKETSFRTLDSMLEW